MEKDDRYNPSTRWAGKQGLAQEGEEEESLFFTLLRQPTGKVENITFHLRNGRQHTLAAEAIGESFFEADYGIVLFFGLGKIHIQGRNLETLYRYLKENRVKDIREFTDGNSLFFSPDALFISKIDYESQNMLRLGIGV
jgi:hypothetical protein